MRARYDVRPRRTLQKTHAGPPPQRTAGGMSNAVRPIGAGARDRDERLPAWAAALVTGLLHLLLLLVALLSPPVTVTPPEGATGGDGGSLQVTWIGEAPPSPQPTPVSPERATPPPTPARAPPAATRIPPPPVVQADDPVTPPFVPTPAQADAPEHAEASPTQRPARLRGQPPGMRLEDLAPAAAGPARMPAVSRGRGSGASESLEVDGYQVYYDHVHETRLREWRDQGMTELFLPLPGTRRFMVCPLEIMLRRGSGACRMVEPDAPELAAIGDARQVILMEEVYRLGKALWSGPGPYR